MHDNNILVSDHLVTLMFIVNVNGDVDDVLTAAVWVGKESFSDETAVEHVAGDDIHFP